MNNEDDWPLSRASIRGHRQLRPPRYKVASKTTNSLQFCLSILSVWLSLARVFTRSALAATLLSYPTRVALGPLFSSSNYPPPPNALTLKTSPSSHPAIIVRSLMSVSNKNKFALHCFSCRLPTASPIQRAPHSLSLRRCCQNAQTPWQCSGPCPWMH